MSTENENVQNESENPYKGFQDHEMRVVVERAELLEKEAKLAYFISESEIYQKLPLQEQHLQKKQLYFMGLYIEVLNERINMFASKYREEKIPQPLDWRSKGEEVIGFFGNEKWDVFVLKNVSALFIDETEKRGKDGRRKAIAATNMEQAQMMAVKSLFE